MSKQPIKLPPGLPEGYELPPDFVPNPDGMSNLDYDGGTAFQLAPAVEADDTAGGGMSDDEAVAFLSRPIREFRKPRRQR